MLKVKYFSYGSNINIERLKCRVETTKEIINKGIPYTLKGWKLIFNAGSIYSKIAFANIVKDVKSEVEGILYDLSPEQFNSLDRYEILYERYYFQIDNYTLGCVYITKASCVLPIEVKPDLHYLNIIIDGCKNTSLNKTYQQLLNYKLEHYKLKKGSKHKKFLK